MKYGVVIAGIPEGHPLYIRRWLTDVLVNLDTEVRQLLCIQSIHTKWAILKQSIAARINHILRSLPPSILQETNFINRFNMIMKCFLADLVKVDPTFIEDHSFKIAQLPPESGGGGLRFAEVAAISAFVASVTSSLPQIMKAYPEVEGIIHRQINNIQQVDDIPEILKEYFHSIEVLKEAGSMISSNTPVSLQGLSEMKQKDFKGLQKRLMQYTAAIRLEEIRTQLSQIQPYHWLLVKQLTAGATPESAAIFNIVPRSYHHMGNNEMFGILRRRFLIKDPEIYQSLKCKCGQNLDPYGWHLQKCAKFSKYRIRTHEEVKDVIARILHTAKVPFASEFCPFKDKEDQNYKRLDLVLSNSRSIYPATNRGKGLIDVTIGNPVREVTGWLNNDYRDHMQQATTIAHIGTKIEEDKRRKYQQLADSHSMEFIPMGFESQGSWGPNTHVVFEALMQRIGDRNNPDRVSKHTKSHYWRQQISFTIHKYVSRHIEDAFASINLKTIQSITTPPNYEAFQTP